MACRRICATKALSSILSTPLSRLREPRAAKATQVFSLAWKTPKAPSQEGRKSASRHGRLAPRKGSTSPSPMATASTLTPVICRLRRSFGPMFATHAACPLTPFASPGAPSIRHWRRTWIVSPSSSRSKLPVATSIPGRIVPPGISTQSSCETPGCTRSSLTWSPSTTNNFVRPANS